MSKIMIKMIA